MAALAVKTSIAEIALEIMKFASLVLMVLFFNKLDNSCLSAEMLGCQTVNATGCATCKAEMGPAVNFRNTGITGCEVCKVDSCAACGRNYLRCDACREGHFRPLVDNTTRMSSIDETRCQEASNFNCAILKDGVGCDSCVMGTGLNFNFANTAYRACAPCQANCLDCRNNSISCAMCHPRYVTYIVSGNDAGCYSCASLSCPASDNACANDEGCTSCEAGNYLTGVSGLDLAQCVGCPNGCTLCSAGDNCTACQENYQLAIVRQNGTTVQICVPNGAARLGLGVLAFVFTILVIIF